MIWGDLIPTTGLKVAASPDFELYDGAFAPNWLGAVIDFYVSCSRRSSVVKMWLSFISANIYGWTGKARIKFEIRSCCFFPAHMAHQVTSFSQPLCMRCE